MYYFLFMIYFLDSFFKELILYEKIFNFATILFIADFRCMGQLF